MGDSLVAKWVRIWHCHYSGSSHCHGTASILGPRTSMFPGKRQKKKRRRRKKEEEEEEEEFLKIKKKTKQNW